ncbi:Casein kinase I-2-like protein [Hordeum vulgare]|nr:Casein kinase I-2-like protein [Hordeum vulgare]
MMWSIWTSCNRWTHDGDKLDPANSVRLTQEALALLDIPLQHATVLRGHGWRPPKSGEIKINTDVAVAYGEGKSGTGGVTRSSTALLGAWCKPHPGVTDSMITEALIVRDGVIFANLIGFLHVLLETDNMEVVNLWNTRLNSRSVVAPILLEIDELCASFHSSVIQHVSRSANGSAHLCARSAFAVTATESWLTKTPSFLIRSLLADCPANTFV